jgi:hypothetical protein
MWFRTQLDEDLEVEIEQEFENYGKLKNMNY